MTGLWGRPSAAGDDTAALQDLPLLVVEDDVRYAAFLSAVLRRAGARVHIAHDVTDARRSLAKRPPALVVLDLGLPGAVGTELVSAIHDAAVPVVVVSGQAAKPTVVAGIDAGADDYLVKPVLPAELVARVRAVLRRRGPVPTGGGSTAAVAGHDAPGDLADLVAGDVRIDRSAKRVERAGQAVTLTRREFDLLVQLVAHAGHTRSRDDLLRAVWGTGRDGAAVNTVNEHVRRLRRKLEDDPARPTLIVTDRGFGYRFVPSAAPETTAP